MQSSKLSNVSGVSQEPVGDVELQEEVINHTGDVKEQNQEDSFQRVEDFKEQEQALSEHGTSEELFGPLNPSRAKDQVIVNSPDEDQVLSLCDTLQDLKPDLLLFKNGSASGPRSKPSLKSYCKIPDQDRRFGVDLLSATSESSAQLSKFDQFLKDAQTRVQSAKHSKTKTKAKSQRDLENVLGFYLGKRVSKPCDQDQVSEMDEDEIEDELMGSDYDDMSQYTHYNDPKKPSDYYDVVMAKYMANDGLMSESRTINDVPAEFYKIPDPLVPHLDKELVEAKKFATEKTPNTGNVRGYTIIIGVAQVLGIARWSTLTNSSIASAVTTFDHDPKEDYIGLWKYIKAFPHFINFISSELFLREINSWFEDQMDLIETAGLRKAWSLEQIRKSPAWNALSKSKFRAPPFSDSHFIWSLEGVDKFRRTGDVRKLHFHLVLLRKDGQSIRTERVTKVIKTVGDYFNRKIGNGLVTLGGVRTRNQLAYIGKEKWFAAVSIRYTGDFVEQVCKDFLPVNSSGGIDRHHSFLFSHGYNDFDFMFNGLTSHLAETATYLGVSCIHCDIMGNDDKYQYCKSWGFDETVLRYLKDTRAEPFMGMFKPLNKADISDFDNWLGTQNENGVSCNERLKVMANYRGVLLSKCFQSMGLSEVETVTLMSALTSIFYNFTHNEKHVHFWDTIRRWMGFNYFYADGNWRNLLVIGGLGAVGKSTLAEFLQRGLGLSNVPQKLVRGTEVGRDAYNPLRLFRFLEECHEGRRSTRVRADAVRAANIFFEFTSVESTQTVLWKTNAPKKAKEWIVAASADVTGFPDYQQYVRWNGEASSTMESYEEWRSQASRRFTVLCIGSVEAFQLPYCKLFYGCNSYVASADGHTFVERLGVPLLGKYACFTLGCSIVFQRSPQDQISCDQLSNCFTSRLGPRLRLGWSLAWPDSVLSPEHCQVQGHGLSRTLFKITSGVICGSTEFQRFQTDPRPGREVTRSKL